VTFDKLRSITEKDEGVIEEIHQVSLAGLLFQHPNWSELEGFHRRRGSLTIEQGCILFRERVVIPTALRTKVPKLLHQG
jgi:hypothetical protein